MNGNHATNSSAPSSSSKKRARAAADDDSDGESTNDGIEKVSSKSVVYPREAGKVFKFTIETLLPSEPELRNTLFHFKSGRLLSSGLQLAMEAGKPFDRDLTTINGINEQTYNPIDGFRVELERETGKILAAQYNSGLGKEIIECEWIIPGYSTPTKNFVVVHVSLDDLWRIVVPEGLQLSPDLQAHIVTHSVRQLHEYVAPDTVFGKMLARFTKWRKHAPGIMLMLKGESLENAIGILARLGYGDTPKRTRAKKINVAGSSV